MVPGRYLFCIKSLWQHACHMGSGQCHLLCDVLKGLLSSRHFTPAPGFKQLLKSLRDKKRKGRRNEVSSLERSPGLELSHGGQGQLQQLSQGGVAGVCVALGQESRQSGIGTNAWLPVLLKQLGHLYLLQLLKVAGTDGSQELVT